jgi:hypothetical protein
MHAGMIISDEVPSRYFNGVPKFQHKECFFGNQAKKMLS